MAFHLRHHHGAAPEAGGGIGKAPLGGWGALFCHMYPSRVRLAPLKYQLLMRAVVPHPFIPLSQLGISLCLSQPTAVGIAYRHCDVSGLSFYMKRVPHASHSLVQHSATIPGGDAHWLLCMLSQWLQHLLTLALEVRDGINARLIADTESLCRG